MAEMMNPALEGATLLFPQGSFITAYAYTGVEDEIKAYQTSAWIGTALMTSPIYDVYGPDAVKLMGQVCTNDFTTLGMNGIRHAVMCNEKGQILTDGVVIRIGEALLEMSKKPQKKCVTLEWNAEDVAEVFATMLSPGEEPCEDITKPCALEYYFCVREFGFEYRADKVLAADKEIGITSGKIISYTYNSMISLAFISAEYAKEGTELEILWGTPGTRQMKVRAKVARFPYNQDYIRNEKRDVSDIPVFER